MAREVTIDQSKLSQLLNNAGMVAMLSPLEQLSKKKHTVKKSCCGTKTTGPTYAEKDAALRDLVNLLSNNAELRQEVKKRLNADVLKIKYKMVTQPKTATKKL
jgi:hypothetical protein